MRTGVEVKVSDEQRRRLEVITTEGNNKGKQRRRARIVLLTADGLGTMEIMAATGSAKVTVWLRRERYMSDCAKNSEAFLRQFMRLEHGLPCRRKSARRTGSGTP